jgi:hypothetical protein
VPVDLLVLVKQLISDFSCLLTVLLVPVLVVPELLVPVSLLLVPVSLLLVPVSLLLLVLGFAKAGELKAPAVTRIIAVKTTMIVNVVVFIYITTTLSSYMYKELLNHVN